MNTTLKAADAACWLLVALEGLPPGLRRRATTMALVPLAVGEATQLLAHASPWPGLDAQDEALARALLGGVPVKSVARELDVTPRTVHRRIARLRQRLGVDSTEQLIVVLSRWGLGVSDYDGGLSQEPRSAGANSSGS